MINNMANHVSTHKDELEGAIVSPHLQAEDVLDLGGEDVTGRPSGEATHQGVWQVHRQKSQPQHTQQQLQQHTVCVV